MVECVSSFNPVCARLGLTCQYAQSEYRKVVHRFNPETEWIFPPFVSMGLISMYESIDQTIESLKHFKIIIDGIKINTIIDKRRKYFNQIPKIVKEINKMKLDEENLPFFIWVFSHFYHWTNSSRFTVESTSGFTHFLIQSKNNPVLGNIIRNFFIDKRLCPIESLPGFIASSTLADVNCLIKCFCLEPAILPIIEKFIDYPHVLCHLSHMILHYPTRNETLPFLMTHFKNNPSLFPFIANFYSNIPSSYIYNDIRERIIRTIDEIGYNNFDSHSQHLIDEMKE